MSFFYWAHKNEIDHNLSVYDVRYLAVYLLSLIEIKPVQAEFLICYVTLRGVIISEVRVLTFGYPTIQKILNTFGALT